MENQIHIGDQKAQQIGQNPMNQSSIDPEKHGVHYWMISTVVFFVMAISGGFYIASLRKQPPASQAVVMEQPKVEWIRKQFGLAWDLEYPENWEVDEAGLDTHGDLGLTGEYNGVSYSLGLGYPIFTDYDPPGIPESLDIWVNKEVSFIPQDKKAAIKIVNANVAGTTAKKVLNLPEKIFDDGTTRRYSENIIHAVYIWKRGDKNPSTIGLKQNSGILDSEKAEVLLDIFLSKLK